MMALNARESLKAIAARAHVKIRPVNLSIHTVRDVAPVQVAVVPLSKKPELIGPAQEVMKSLRGEIRVEYDQTGDNIGRRYRRQDEIGTPFCVTIDFETLNDQALTIRRRDSTEQERVKIAELADRLGALTS